MLASTWMDPCVGVDTHIVLIPSPAGPVPTPVPLPFIGMVFDPMGAAVGAAIGCAMGGGPGLVLVNGLPATNAGTNVTNMMTMPHLPVPGVSFASGMPGNDAELNFGGSKVGFAGSYAVRMGEISMSCGDPVRLPTSAIIAIPKGPPVLVMRPPVPDVSTIAMGLAFKAAFKALGAALRQGAKFLRKLRSVQRNSDFMGRMSNRLRSGNPARQNSRWNRAVCFVTGHPVDVATGRMFTDAVDFELPGPLPLKFERVYDTSLSWRQGPLGRGWSHALDQAVWVERGRVVYRAEDGREIEFHTVDLPEHRLAPNRELFDPINQLTLKNLGSGAWEVRNRAGIRHRFAPILGAAPNAAGVDEAKLVQQVSRDGHHKIELHYDKRGRLEWVRDSGGRILRFEHDGAGRLVRVKLPVSRSGSGGNAWHTHREYRYSSDGDLIEVVDALGHAWRFEYATHLMVKETDRAGLSFYFQYDGLGAGAKCIRTWGDPTHHNKQGHHSKSDMHSKPGSEGGEGRCGIYDHVIHYDVNNKKTLVENSLGDTTVYEMDEAGQVISVTDPLGNASRYEYDEHTGKPTQETDPLGNETCKTYDARGQLIHILGPDGAQMRMDYEQDQLVRAEDPNGHTWNFTYDALGHLKETTTPPAEPGLQGERTRYQWREGLLRQVRRPGGAVTELEYDAAHNLARTVEQSGAETRYSSDGLGHLVKLRDARGAPRTVRYDAEGRPLSVELPLGLVRELKYDAEGNLTHAKDANGEVALRYSGFHQVVERIEAGTSLKFEYDTEEQLAAVLNEAGERYRFERDKAGRVTVEQGFDGKARQYTRDACGRVLKERRPSGRTSQMQYDAAGRLLRVEHGDGGFSAFERRPDGALMRAENKDGEVVFERDPMGRVIREEAAGEHIHYRFSPGGGLRELTSSLGARQVIEQSAAGDLNAVHIGAASEAIETRSFRFERDLLGAETRRTVPGGIEQSIERDLLGRPTARRTERSAPGSQGQPGTQARPSPATVLDARSYKWRGEDQIAEILSSTFGTTHYEHDTRGRLTAERTASGGPGRSSVPGAGDDEVLHRALDQVGNVYRRPDKRDRTYGPGGRLEEADGTKYLYDEDGNQVERQLPDGSAWRYHYSDEGFLSEVERPDQKRVRFTYDPFGRRTEKALVLLAEDGAETVETQTRFVWSGNVPLHEDSSVDGLTTWHFEPGTFTPFAKETAGPAKDKTSRRYAILTDHLGTPTEMTDELGELAWQAQLDLYGVPKVQTGDRQDCPFRFSGQYEDEETGLYYNRFRYYAPEEGRYVTQDPIGLLGGFQAFGYVDDPATWVDPLGLSKTCGPTTPDGDETFEILDGVRRAKAAELLGQPTVRAEVQVGGRTLRTIDVPIDRLLSPKTAIDASSSPAQVRRFSNVLEGTRKGQAPPIAIQPGSRGTPIADVALQ